MSRLNRVLAAPLVLAVRLYQRFISPLSPPSCRFYPSCSAYAVTALTRFGPIKGTWLAIRRVGRCHPWNPGGVDPVPLTWETRGDIRPEDFRPADLGADEARDVGDEGDEGAADAAVTGGSVPRRPSNDASRNHSGHTSGRTTGQTTGDGARAGSPSGVHPGAHTT